MAFHAPYLEAIQAVPGDTPGEKFRWIASSIKQRAAGKASLEDIVESEKAGALAPLFQIEAAKLLNKADRQSQSNYEAIAEALKSEDSTIVGRALQARSFFDGTNKRITNVAFFFDHLFPYVSVNTRMQMIKMLALRLAKEPSLAEEFFLAIDSAYGIDQAMPLLPSCSEEFIYNFVVQRKITLSSKTVKILFRKNPDFVVRYLRLSKPEVVKGARNVHEVNINDYNEFLPKLIKKRLNAFVELYEMHEVCPPHVNLSKKCAEAFLKNGKEHLQRKPRLYVKLLPLRMISASRMESIFPKLLPDDVKDYDTEDMLHYLEYYPQDKKFGLLGRSYREVYKKSVLENSNNVTPGLLNLLPTEERVKQARIKIAEEEKNHPEYRVNCKYVWRCYLTTKEAIPEIRREIATTAEFDDRAILLCQMIYTCKVNGDDPELLETLKYLRDRHKNEQPWFLLKVLECLLNFYDLPQLSAAHWSVLMEIIQRAHIKDELLPGNTISTRIVEAAAHYRLLNGLPIDPVIEVLVDMYSLRFTRLWNILTKYPDYERKCLDACLAVASQRMKTGMDLWKTDRVGILRDLVSSIYDFNERHVKRNSRTESMWVKNYPWLVEELEVIIAANRKDDHYSLRSLEDMLCQNEKELCQRLWPPKEDVATEIKTGEALALLKTNPKMILEQMSRYSTYCQEKWNAQDVKRFVRASRWYKDIPVRLAEKCAKDVLEKKCERSLEILAVLLHGRTFAELAERLLPTRKTIDVQDEDAKISYNLFYHICAGAKLANPPVPLTLIEKITEGDHLSLALMALTNLCRRTALPTVIRFAKGLTSKRVSIRKHGIRLMYMAAPRDQLCDYLLSVWKTEEHYSIRDVLLQKVIDLFSKDPRPATWSIVSEMLGGLHVKDVETLPKFYGLLRTTPNEFVAELVQLLLKTITRLEEEELLSRKAVSYTSDLLNYMDVGVCNLLPEEFIEELLRRFLFHPETEIAQAAGSFAVSSYLIPAEDRLESRMKTFGNVFTETVKNGWDVPHPTKSRFYPMNYAVHTFVDELMHWIPFNTVDHRLVDGILTAFLTVLEPQQDAKSYLLLVYAREQPTAETLVDFGKKVARKLPELINIFSAQFISFMTHTLQYFLSATFADQDNATVRLRVVEGLLVAETIEADLMAVNLLSPIKDKEYVARYDWIVKKFRKHEHPAIRSTICHMINKIGYDECIDDE